MPRLKRSGLALVAIAAIAGLGPAQGADQGALDQIAIRKELMNQIESQTGMLESGLESFDPLANYQQGGAVAAMLRAFPYLFAETTTPALAGDATSAGEAVWAETEAFRQSAGDLAQLADAISFAADGAELAPLVARLREGCTACHDRFLNYSAP